jgi:hypothetical protein
MEKRNNALFGRENFILMAVGGVIILAGIFLMAGGKSTDPNVFSDQEVYSTRRITVAPILILAGLLLEVFAIMKKAKS